MFWRYMQHISDTCKQYDEELCRVCKSLCGACRQWGRSLGAVCLPQAAVFMFLPDEWKKQFSPSELATYQVLLGWNILLSLLPLLAMVFDRSWKTILLSFSGSFIYLFSAILKILVREFLEPLI
ncbi:uncharacterized protein EV420DRAFT_1125400 [Desarmillaria tabescens]|uniref:Uncharacterized protein n=1 Tax=Armillaria tabescens TaxID=1929756 RepID=A0AA39MP73_ARMTA|nr:uncharacterized protein EV420DRAFT_1125400 [Desarmillaria tabescens]KAK0441183.1 hypothetical protein EV420DRAFT_1125400 [Desarmillaria tabescens]